MANKVFGLILLAFIAALVGLVLTQTIASNISGFTDTILLSNTTVTAGAYPTVNVTDLTGQEFISGKVFNATNVSGVDLITNTNVSIGEGISATTGLKSVQLTILDPQWASRSLNITYTYGPDGYVDNAAGRSVSNLILIFLAIGIAVVVLAVTMRPELMSTLDKLRR